MDQDLNQKKMLIDIACLLAKQVLILPIPHLTHTLDG